LPNGKVSPKYTFFLASTLDRKDALIYDKRKNVEIGVKCHENQSFDGGGQHFPLQMHRGYAG
jgi:hypothetical protein